MSEVTDPCCSSGELSHDLHISHMTNPSNMFMYVYAPEIFQNVYTLYSDITCRSHDNHMGRQFFSQLKAARDALGLQYRFEILLDTGRKGLKLSPHFLRRVRKDGCPIESDCYGNGCHGDCCSHGTSFHDDCCQVTYTDLENVPCVVVMTGEERPHLPLPRYAIMFMS